MLMPPYHPLVSPLTPLLSPLFAHHQRDQLKHYSQSQLHHKHNCKEGERKMMTSLLNKKKLIPILVFILSCASVLRLLKITIVSTSSSRSLSIRPPPALPPAHHKNFSLHHAVVQPQESSKNRANLTEKERGFLFDLISHKSPCNLLVFGLEQEYSTLVSSLNAGGVTVILEDDDPAEKSSTIKKTTANVGGTNSVVYKLEYPTIARDAFKLLKHARENKHCSPSSSGSFLQKSRCKLALKKLPLEIYKLKWDVVIVDGPCGHKPECPGRMASIYTASLLARKDYGNVTTNVLVHDVHRMIEKWFSWEFLCENNLVSSKGKFWNFGIPPQSNYSNATTFCSN